MLIYFKSSGTILGKREWDAVPRIGDIVVLDKMNDAHGYDGPFPVREVRWFHDYIEIQLQTGR